MSRFLSLLALFPLFLALVSSAALQPKVADPAVSKVEAANVQALENLKAPTSADKAAGITGCNFDLAFVLDRSESVTELNFPKVKDFVKQVISSLSNQLKTNVGVGGLQVSLVPFNTFANVALYLNQATSVSDVFAAVDALQYFPGLSNPADALEKIESEVFTASHGDRADMTNAIIYVGDGSRTMGTIDPVPLAAQFRNTQNGQIIAVGVNGLNGNDNGIAYDQLIKLTGSKHNVFNVTNYDGLYSIFKDVSAQLNCRTAD